MERKFEETPHQKDAEEHPLGHLVEEYDDESTPLKVRKINLLETVGLPISETDILSKDNKQEIKEKIIERLHGGDVSLVVRFSGRDDGLGMPSCYIDNEEDLGDILEQMEDIFTHDPNISHVILQSATPRREASNKVSGRLMMYDDVDSGYDEIVELYKGARSTGVLNLVDPSDPQFHRLVKPLGGFMKPREEIDPSSTLTTGEVVGIVRKLNDKRDAIEIVQSVLRQSRRHSRNDYTLEFSYRDGDLIFTDID
ncbi:MAG: hypothetical protein PHV43_02255 [Candidatus Colwellbacteria bacterium]|nr:hypothetical protein [Candidatus Colwellbacteria bacterium]